MVRYTEDDPSVFMSIVSHFAEEFEKDNNSFNIDKWLEAIYGDE
tara:strand:- start:232 stop:363 length:132 start_codon:yes stop_codon:yes gene_type:complete